MKKYIVTNIPKFQQLKLSLTQISEKELNQMAKGSKSKVVEVKRGRKADPENVANKANGKPLVVHLPAKLHARAKVASMVLGANLSTTIRGLLTEWLNENRKKISAAVEAELSTDEGEDEDTEDAEDVEDEDTESDEDSDDEDDE